MKIEQIHATDLTNHNTYDKLKEQGEQNTPHSFLVSKITEGLRDKNRANIYLDNEFFCSLDISQISELKIKTGQYLDAAEKSALKQASNFGKLYTRALKYALSRPRSTQEMRDYLQKTTIDRPISYQNPKTKKYSTKIKSGYDQSLLQPVLKRLTERGYIDDRKFAEFWIENRKVRQGISSKKLQIELIKKGISRDLIEELMLKSPRDEFAEIQKIIAKKRHKYDNEKLIQYLFRHGFDLETAKTAVHETGSQN